MNSSAVGLSLSVGTSVSTVFTDVSRKKVLDRGFNATPISFWCKFVAFIAYGVDMVGLLSRNA